MYGQNHYQKFILGVISPLSLSALSFPSFPFSVPSPLFRSSLFHSLSLCSKTPPSSPARGSEEPCKLLDLYIKRIFGVSRAKRTHLVAANIVKSLLNKIQQLMQMCIFLSAE